MPCFLGLKGTARRASESPLLLLTGWMKKPWLRKSPNQSGGRGGETLCFQASFRGLSFLRCLHNSIMLLKSFRKAVTQSSLRPGSFKSKRHHTLGMILGDSCPLYIQQGSKGLPLGLLDRTGVSRSEPFLLNAILDKC